MHFETHHVHLSGFSNFETLTIIRLYPPSATFNWIAIAIKNLNGFLMFNMDSQGCPPLHCILAKNAKFYSPI